MIFNYDVRLIARCFWLWEESKSNTPPDIHEVAQQNQLYINDLMNFATVVAYAKTQKKHRYA